jgi:uncharacterized protein YjhX (UPF0386 family)
VEDKPLEMCKDIPFDLELTQSIAQPKRLNGEGLLQLTCQVDLVKDDTKSAKVAKGNDVHVKPKKVDMLMQKDVSLKVLNLLKRKSELASASGKSTVSIDKPIASEVDEMSMTLDKE